MNSSRLVRRRIAATPARRLLVAAIAGISLAGCARARHDDYRSIVTVVEDRRTPARVEAISLLGVPLHAQSGGAGFTKRQADLAASLRALRDRPPDPAKIVWVGRRLGYLWRMKEAAAVYSRAIRMYPDYAPFYRHRGHRYISLRRFERAERDLAYAARLIDGAAEQIEPDGMPNARHIPLTTTAFNVYYHFALARYMQGDFEGALQAHDDTLKHTRGFDDNLVAVTYWRYLALRRLGQDEEARRAIEPIHADMDIIENDAYHTLLLAYKGERSPAELEAALSGGDVNAATIGYGLGSWHLLEGDRDRAATIFEQVVAGPQWPAFGFIAAEAELARMRRARR